MEGKTMKCSSHRGCFWPCARILHNLILTTNTSQHDRLQQDGGLAGTGSHSPAVNAVHLEEWGYAIWSADGP